MNVMPPQFLYFSYLVSPIVSTVVLVGFTILIMTGVMRYVFKLGKLGTTIIVIFYLITAVATWYIAS